MSAPVSILDINRFSGTTASPEVADLVARRQRVLGPAAPLLYEDPVHLVRGQGAWVWDAQKRRYLDLYNNVVSVGHCHPHVVEAIAAQAARLNTNTRYLHENIVEYAERLLVTLPEAIARMMFTCTGSEANDLALRMAAMHTGRRGVIVTEAAYHGGTALTDDVSPSTGGIASWVRTVPPPSRADTDGACWRGEVARAADDLDRAGYGLAALLVDSVFSSDGIHPALPGVLAPAAGMVQSRGALLIADEVQPGFGRLGTGMWGFERQGLHPDIVTMGKPMANGLPVAAVAARADLVDRFGVEENYFNTFGGNPVSMAAALAVLDVIEQEHLIDHVAKVGAHLADGVLGIGAPQIGEVRALGLFMGVDIVGPGGAPDPVGTSRIINALRHEGFLISSCGYTASTLKIRPPFALDAHQVDLFVDALDRVLAPGFAATGS